MNLAFFCVWEEAGVWAHWNPSFDVHLNSLEPASCFSPSWIPSGCTIGDGCHGWWWLDGCNTLLTDRAGDILHPYRFKFSFLLDLLARVGVGDSVLCRCEGLRVLQRCGVTFLRSSEPRRWKKGAWRRHARSWPLLPREDRATSAHGPLVRARSRAPPRGKGAVEGNLDAAKRKGQWVLINN